MNEQERINQEIQMYRESFDNLQEGKEKMIENLMNLQIKNLEHIRGFLLQVILLSAAVFISIIPLLKDELPSLISSTDFAWLGLFLLGINSLFGVWYMNEVLTRENRNLDNLREFHRQEFNKHIELTLQFMEKQKSYLEYGNEKIKLAKESVKKEEEITKESKPKNKIIKKIDKYFTDILTWGLISGVLIIFVSFVL